MNDHVTLFLLAVVLAHMRTLTVNCGSSVKQHSLQKKRGEFAFNFYLFLKQKLISPNISLSNETVREIAQTLHVNT